ncbi:hypothetical protein HN385_03105 [archaeon]|jgi:hypothetical protein|nr:hypothetical protein [archaeon]MBT3450823.1 hypothetical protein [archaeon]MBT7193567.1 hypothetical protein [archaeon]MBT7381238.1 hypothetical protein [archaeon]MBT7508468.1 hypothetical protein [archaeon]
MLNKISLELNNIISNFNVEDKIIFKNKTININKDNFETLHQETTNSIKTITYIDGGQAEIFSTGNFCLSLIRVAGVKFQGKKKLNFVKHEFYLLTYTKFEDNDLIYVSKIFPNTNSDLKNSDVFNLINEQELTLSSQDSTIRDGLERASISKITNMARRFTELRLAKQLAEQNFSDYILLDGTLDVSFKGEDKILLTLPRTVCSLAKSSSLFTVQGNNPNLLLSKLGPQNTEWSYFLECSNSKGIMTNTYFVKLHSKAKHIFRFEGNKEILLNLLENSQDALFLGYPYGLIFSDRIARVSNNEKNSLKARFMLNKENKEIMNYLTNTNAHDILDNIS